MLVQDRDLVPGPALERGAPLRSARLDRRCGADDGVDHERQQVVLALAVLVERAERLAGLVGDLLHREPVAVRAFEQPGRGLHERHGEQSPCAFAES